MTKFTRLADLLFILESHKILSILTDFIYLSPFVWAQNLLLPPIFYTNDADKLKTVPIDLKKLSDVVDVENVKKLYMIISKVDDIEGKIASTTWHINKSQYDEDKQTLEKRLNV